MIKTTWDLPGESHQKGSWQSTWQVHCLIGVKTDSWPLSFRQNNAARSVHQRVYTSTAGPAERRDSWGPASNAFSSNALASRHSSSIWAPRAPAEGHDMARFSAESLRGSRCLTLPESTRRSRWYCVLASVRGGRLILRRSCGGAAPSGRGLPRQIAGVRPTEIFMMLCSRSYSRPHLGRLAFLTLNIHRPRWIWPGWRTRRSFLRSWERRKAWWEVAIAGAG